MINEFLKKYFPKLNDFFIRNDFSISNFVHKWLVTIFSECYMEETTYLIWDFLFLEGNIVLIKTCLIIFCILKRKLLKFEHNFEELFSILSFDTEKIDPKTPTLLYGLSFKKFEFTDEYIEETRDLLSISVIKNIDNDNLKKFEMNKKMKKINEKKSKDLFICNENWPICENNKSKEEPNFVIKYLVLHHKNEPQKIGDYFFNYTNFKNKNLINQYIENENDKTKDEENLKEEEYYDILIERQEHCCITHKENKEESIINIEKNVLTKVLYHKSNIKNFIYIFFR